LSQQLSQREDQLQKLKEELKRVQGEMLRFQEDYIKLEKELKARDQVLQRPSPAEAVELPDDTAAGGQKNTEEKRNGLKKMLDSLEKKP
jgi:septal ring factor EnvC (AmiA/AmiB activator)